MEFWCIPIKLALVFVKTGGVTLLTIVISLIAETLLLVSVSMYAKRAVHKTF